MLEVVRDRAWLYGAILTAVAYGTNIALFAITSSFLVKRWRLEKEKDGHASRQTVILLAYAWTTFALATLCVASTVDMIDVAFIEQKGRTPAKFLTETYGVIAVSAMGNVAYSVLNWFVDALLLWRCHVIYRNSTTSPLLLMAVPMTLFVGSFVSGVIYLERLTDEATSPFRNITLVLVYGSIFLTLNLILTFMMVFRLLLYRKRITSLVGSRYAGHYTSIASILIESAFIMDVMLILVLIPLVLHSPLVTLPLLITPQIQAIASFLIVYKVAQGTAWLSGTANELIAQHSDETTPDEMLSAARFRVTSQMTQASTAVHFNHVQSISAWCPAPARSKANPTRKTGIGDNECECEDSGDVQGVSDGRSEE